MCSGEVLGEQNLLKGAASEEDGVCLGVEPFEHPAVWRVQKRTARAFGLCVLSSALSRLKCSRAVSGSITLRAALCP